MSDILINAHIWFLHGCRKHHEKIKEQIHISECFVDENGSETISFLFWATPFFFALLEEYEQALL